jgi:hypothetical protein
MRTILLAIALCAAPVAVEAQQAQAKPPRGVNVQYDRIQNRTVVRSEILNAAQGMLSLNDYPIKIEVVTMFEGTDVQAAPPGAIMRVRIEPGLSVGWKLLNADRQLYLLLADGRRVAYSGTYSNEIGRYNVVEVVDVVVAMEDLRAIAGAAKVEGRIGPKDFKLEGGSLNRLRTFVGYVTGRPMEQVR